MVLAIDRWSPWVVGHHVSDEVAVLVTGVGVGDCQLLPVIVNGGLFQLLVPEYRSTVAVGEGAGAGAADWVTGCPLMSWPPTACCTWVANDGTVLTAQFGPTTSAVGVFVMAPELIMRFA